MRQLLSRWWCFGFALCVAPLNAAELSSSQFQFVGKTYSYEFTVTIEAPLEATRAVVTDYDNIKQINDDVIDSRVLETYEDGSLKRKLWLEQCLLIFNQEYISHNILSDYLKYLFLSSKIVWFYFS